MLRFLGKRELAKPVSRRMVPRETTKTGAAKKLRREGVQVAGLPEGEQLQGRAVARVQQQAGGNTELQLLPAVLQPLANVLQLYIYGNATVCWSRICQKSI